MPVTKKPGQAERSAAMRARLIAAAKQSLLDVGYGGTTAVDVCERAGVTRGALFHHFADLSDLFAATLEEVCATMVRRAEIAAARMDGEDTLPGYIDRAWVIFGHADFKIVIEVWMAARNDPALRKELEPVMERIKLAMTPEVNPVLARKVGASPEAVAFFRLIVEAMIGMALGRAITPKGKLGHEAQVLALLKTLAQQRRS